MVEIAVIELGGKLTEVGNDPTARDSTLELVNVDRKPPLPSPGRFDCGQVWSLVASPYFGTHIG